MPEIIPIRDLKNTNAICKCTKTEPIFTAYGDMVIMILGPRCCPGVIMHAFTRRLVPQRSIILKQICPTFQGYILMDLNYLNFVNLGKRTYQRDGSLLLLVAL
ncbi:MAG: hypothetical protein ACLTGG_03880 [Subdoligranulum sp.]